MKTKSITKILVLTFALLCWSYAAQADCKPQAKQSNLTFFRDLRGANLYVRLTPGKYVVAIDCHGREQQCTDEATRNTGSSAAEFLKAITEDYRTLPEALRPDNVTLAFNKMLNEKLMPFVLPGKECKAPQLVVLNREDRGDYLKNATQSDPATLTFAVTINIQDSTTPPIAILTVNYYRPDPARTSFWTEVLPNYVTAIPLNLPDDQIDALLLQFVNHFEVPVRKGEN